MQITARSYLTSGIAALGAGAIAFSPIQPLPDHAAVAQERAVSNLAINLAASTIDPFTPWIQTFQQAAANIQVLGDFYNEDPTPILTTIGKNIITYGDYVMAGQGLKIPGLIANNITTFFQGPWWNAPNQPIPAVNNATPPAPIYSSNYVSNTRTATGLSASLFNSQRGAYNFAVPLLPPLLGPSLPENLAAALPAILQFTATPYSGVVAGLVSPILSALAQLNKSVTAARTFFDNGDVIGGINELINIPANVTNASLNGFGPLDLTSLVIPILPPALQPIIRSFSLNLGGWLTGPVPLNGTLTNANQPPTQFTGGTLFDILGVSAVFGVGGTTTGLPVGYFQSAIGLGQFLGTNMLAPPPASAAGVLAPKVAAAALPPPAAATTDPPGAGSEPDVQAPKDNTPDTLDEPKALSQSAETEAPAPKRQTHRGTSAASSDNATSDNDSDSGSRTSRRHVG